MAVNADVDLISSNVTLPNGIVVPNRLVKAAMEEGIGHSGGCPGPEHQRLYSRWGKGGWGVVITGNVQVDPRHLATPHDRYIPDYSKKTESAYSQLHGSIVSSASGNPDSTPITLVQLSHPGLQSSSTACLSRLPFSSAVAPISARPDMGSSLLGWIISHSLWPIRSRRLDVQEWLGIVKMFVRGAKLMEDAGWDGVQIHSAHGYLLAEYLSPHTNPQPELLPGVPSHVPLRLHLLYLILQGLHAATSLSFVKSVKINCSDFVQGGLDEDQASEIVKEIVSWKIVDILEISGGTYASPAFASPETIGKPSSRQTRQSLFAHFTTSLLPHLPAPPEGPAILLTGGLHDRALIAASLKDRACDLVGIGRPACVHPECAREIILNKDVPDGDTYLGGYNLPGTATLKWILGGSVPGMDLKKTKRSAKGIPLVGAGISTLWHEWQLCRIGRGVDPDLGMYWLYGLFMEMVWFGLLGGGPLGWWRAWTGGSPKSKEA